MLYFGVFALFALVFFFIRTAYIRSRPHLCKKDTVPHRVTFYSFDDVWTERL